MALKPFVYWAQTEATVFMRVEIKDVVRSEICIEEEEVEVSAVGIGSQGGTQRRNYHFVVEFFLPIDKEASSFEILDRGIQITLKKKDEDWWPRLLYEQQKLSWLKIDFDRWKSPEDYEESDEDKKISDNPFCDISTEDMIRNKYPDLYKDLEKSELGYVSERTRKVYLFCYNLFMFCGFFYVFLVMNLRYAAVGEEFVPKTWETVGNVMKMMHLMMILDILNPVFGYTNGNVLEALIQVGGRNVLIFALIDAEPRMHEKPVVFYLFMTYSVIELFRYPYYILKIYNMEISLLTWIRYTVWIPLYPLGFVCEGVIILRDIPYFEETERFSVILPNAMNWSFYFPNVMRFYLLFLFFPFMYTMMNHMYHQRCKKLNIRQHSLNKKKRED